MRGKNSNIKMKEIQKVSNHMASDIHNKEDTMYEIIGREDNW